MTLARQDDLGWFLDDFVVRVADVAHTIVVSADGVLLARSSTLPPANADQLAAVASGLASLSAAAARTFDAGGIVLTSVEMDQGYLFTMTMGPGRKHASAPGCQPVRRARVVQIGVRHDVASR